MLSDSKPRIILILLVILFILLMMHNLTAIAADRKEEKKSEEAFQLELAKDQISESDIFWGVNHGTITNPRCVDYGQIVQSTEEYKKIVKEKITHGGAKYWLLIARASDMAVKKIQDFAVDNKVEFICSKSALLPLLSSLPEFKDVKIQELERKFDITKKILAYQSK